MQQKTTVVIADQTIYDILKRNVYKHPEKYSNVVVRLGCFHIALNYMGAIDYLMKGSGIEELLSDSGI